MRSLFVIAVLSSIAGPTAGQTAAPPPCATSTPRLLGSFAGDFDVRVSFRSGPTSWDSTIVRSRLELDLGGCVLVERFDGTRYGEPYSYVAIWGTSGDSTHPIQRFFVHSQHGLLGLSEGGWNQAGDTLTVADSVFLRGGWVQERHRLTRSLGAGFTTEGRRSEDGGKTWIVTMRAQYTRRPRRRGVRGRPSGPR